LASVPIRVLAAVSQENARALVAGPTATGVPLVALALTAVVAASLRARRIAPLVLVPVVLGAWTAYPLAIPDVDPHAPARLYFSRLPALAVVLFALASVACFATRRLERAPATSDASSSRP